MRRRRSSRFLHTSSRESSATRRAPLAAGPAVPPPPPQARQLATLVGHVVAKAKGEKGAAERLARHVYRLRQAGLASLVEATNHALLADGGRGLRLLKDAPREVAGVAALHYVRAAQERGITATDAAAFAFRSCACGAVADALLAKMLAGTATTDETKLAEKLGTWSRLDWLTALQLQRAADANRPPPSLDEVFARFRAENPEPAGDEHDDDEGSDQDEQQ